MEHKQPGMKVRKGNLLRASLIVLAAVMLLCSTYLVTLAFTKKESGKAVNTFFPAGLATELKIVEKDPKDENGNGIYDDALTADEVTSETYYFAPGVTLKKQVYVKVSELKENAYLYISYTDTIHGNALSDKKELPWQIDTANWMQIEDPTHKRLVYVYVGPNTAKDKNGILTAGDYTAADGKMDVILNDSVSVLPTAYDISESTPEEYLTSTLSFSAYLVQAIGFDDYQEAWNSTHGAVAKCSDNCSHVKTN